MKKNNAIMAAALIIAILATATYAASNSFNGVVSPTPTPNPTGTQPTPKPTTTPTQPASTPTPANPTSTASPTINPTQTTTATPTPKPTSSTSNAPTSNPTSTTTNPPPTPSPTTPGGSTNTTVYISNSTTVAEELAVNQKSHEKPEDYVWDDSQVVDIALNSNSITVNPPSGATVSGSKVTITSVGNYRIHGTLTNGQVVVNTQDIGTVRLLLNGVNIDCSTSAPIYIMDANKTIIILEGTTQNQVADDVSYVLDNPAEGEPNAAIFAKCDLTISGSGTLRVDANYNDGIASKDGLIIQSGTLIVDSVDDGIRGRDYIIVKNGNLNLNVDGVGLKSDNDENDKRGYVLVENGEITINSNGDAIEGETDALIIGGNFALTAGGGSSGTINAGTSAKGIKAAICIIIDGGTFTENTADDAINSNGKVTINGGTFSISTGDDAVHADSTVVIRNGDINIAKSYEGIESAIIIINNGNIHIRSSDDGLNIAGGKDDSGFVPGRPPDAFTAANYHLYIHGGYIYVNADGDGVDSNGAITMTGGKLVVDGPTTFMNVPVDHDSPFNMTGGYLLAVGSSGSPIAPAQAPNSISTQYSVLVNFNTTFPANTLIHIRSSAGVEICTFKPTKTYQSIVFSSTALTKGTSYDIYYGGSSTGVLVDGLYQGGTYTAGTKYRSFTISSMVTKIN